MIGRKEEVRRMKHLLRSKRSEFLAVTGRRRVGKTFLIDALLREHYCFTMTGIQNGSHKEQLFNFSVKLSEFMGTDSPEIFESWQTAFLRFKAYLRSLEKTQKHVIFIDELPWVATARSGFVQMLAHLWNDYLSKESHFLLVICGSATSWVTRKIVNDRGGLHNRLTEIIHLHPFNIQEAHEFLHSRGIRLSNQELARIYMALGGIPYYLENLRKGESFAVAIERICFSPSGILRNEYENLYKALFRNAEMYLAIVETLAGHPQGMTHDAILNKLGIDRNGTYHRTFKNLLHSDFVTEIPAYGKRKRGAYFMLIDHYSVFYHRFILPNRNYSAGVWQQLAAGQAYKIWSGYAFESLCFRHIDLIKRAIGIAAVQTQTSRMNIPGSKDGEGFQVDLIIDRRDHTINLCEIKFHSGPFTITKAYYQDLIRKRQRFIEHTGTRKQVFLTFITNHGVVENEYALEIVDVEVTLEDLLRG